MIFGWGTKSKMWAVDNEKTLIVTWKYFSIFFLRLFNYNFTWHLQGNNRSEDRILTEEQVLHLMPKNSPELSIWDRYSGWIVLVGFLFFSLVTQIAGSNNQERSSTSLPQTREQNNNSKMSEQEAIEKVENLDEIKKWKALFSDDGRSPNTGGIPLIYVWKETSEAFEIEAYESKADHNANFGFYKVDKNDGQVYKMKKI